MWNNLMRWWVMVMVVTWSTLMIISSVRTECMRCNYTTQRSLYVACSVIHNTGYPPISEDEDQASVGGDYNNNGSHCNYCWESKYCIKVSHVSLITMLPWTLIQISSKLVITFVMSIYIEYKMYKTWKDKIFSIHSSWVSWVQYNITFSIRQLVIKWTNPI